MFSGHKEIKAIKTMVQSYTQNPNFGNPKKFKEELESVILKVQKFESDLLSLHLQLSDANYQLGQKKSSEKCPLITPNTLHDIVSDSPEGSRSSSAGYGTISNWSASDENLGVHHDISADDIDTVVALYSFNNDCIESSIAMEAGEEFIVTEGDEGGWTKVRRKNINSEVYEGYVPTAYLQFCHGKEKQIKNNIYSI
jgi:hypothetical protein